MMTTEMIEKIIKDCKSDNAVLKALKGARVPFTNLSADSGSSLDVRIKISEKTPFSKGYIRIYNLGHRQGYRVQHFTPCKMVYSGIPTFFG